jgi:hypothetical protein
MARVAYRTQDFFWEIRIIELDQKEEVLDIHHIFPRKWCEDHKIGANLKFYRQQDGNLERANLKIGAMPLQSISIKPSAIELCSCPPAAMDAILSTQCITPSFLRADDFGGLFQDRKKALFSLVEKAMGKQASLRTNLMPKMTVI